VIIMSFAILNLPAGCTVEQKKRLMAGMKAACAEGFKLPPKECFCWIQEIAPENMGEDVEHLKSAIIYTAYGKAMRGKELVSARFDALCNEVFGDPAGRNIIIFKEKIGENVGIKGTVRCLLD